MRGALLAASALAAAVAVAVPVLAQDIAVPQGIAPQVVAMDPEPGGVAFTLNGDGSGSTGGAGGAPSAAAPYAGGGGGSSGAVAVAGSGAGTGAYDTPQLATLAAQPYGTTAIQDAQNVGVDPATTAALAKAESNFRNVPAANGSTSANGVWQVTAGTASDTIQRYDLGYTAADLKEPENQAVVANRVILQYAAATQNAMGAPASVADTYGSYVFGPSVGPRLVAADGSTPMSSIVPARSLANNGMSNWTVGQWRGYANTALGPAASRPALLPRS